MAYTNKPQSQPLPEPGLDVQLGDALDSMYWKQAAFSKDPELAQVVADLEAAGHPVTAQDWVAAANNGQVPQDNPIAGMGGGLLGSLPGAAVGALVGGPVGLLAGGAVSALGARLGSQTANPGEAGGSVLPDLLGALAPRAIGSVAGRLAGSKLTGSVAKKGLTKVSQGLGTIGGPTGIRAAMGQPGLIQQALAQRAATRGANAATGGATQAVTKAAGNPAIKRGAATKMAQGKPVVGLGDPDNAYQLSKMALKLEPKVDTPMFNQWPVAANKLVKDLGSTSTSVGKRVPSAGSKVMAKGIEQAGLPVKPTSVSAKGISQVATGDSPELVRQASSLLSSATPKMKEMALSRIQYGTQAVPVTMRELITLLERDVMRENMDEIIKRSAVNEGLWKPARKYPKNTITRGTPSKMGIRKPVEEAPKPKAPTGKKTVIKVGNQAYTVVVDPKTGTPISITPGAVIEE